MRSVFWPRCGALLSVVLGGRGAANTEPLLLSVLPRSARVKRNGYHDADEFTLEVDLRALPFDPELISSMAVELYMFEETPDQPRTEWAIPEHQMIVGLADEPEMSVDDEAGVLKVSGRDYTSLLIDQEWDPRKKIPSGRPLDETVQAIADAAAPPGARLRFRVSYESVLAPLPTIVGRTRRSTKRKGLWVKPGKTVWAVIYDLAIAEGMIAYVRGDTIHITDPRTQTQASAAAAPQLVYGRNVQSLTATRKLARERVPQILVAAYDPVAQARVEAIYPENSRAKTDAVGIKKNEILRIVAPAGVYDRDALRQIARTRFEAMARTEATYTVTTRHLEDPDGLSMLDLDAGRPVWIKWDPFNGEAMRALTEAQRVDHLRAQGFSAGLSQFVASYYERLDQFRQPYYTRTVEYQFESDGGMTIAIEAVNYVSEVDEGANAA